MAKTHFTQAAPAASVAQVTTSNSQLGEKPLIVETGMTGDLDWSCYKGTRAQLEAEGVIPEGTKWPTRDSWTSWTKDGLRFHLHRSRPGDMKGPKSLWVQGDWWRLMWAPANPLSCNEQRLRRKLEQAVALTHLCSPAGQTESRAAFQRYCAAERDNAFQAFKAVLLPSTKKAGLQAKVAL